MGGVRHVTWRVAGATGMAVKSSSHHTHNESVSWSVWSSAAAWAAAAEHRRPRREAAANRACAMCACFFSHPHINTLVILPAARVPARRPAERVLPMVLPFCACALHLTVTD